MAKVAEQWVVHGLPSPAKEREVWHAAGKPKRYALNVVDVQATAWRDIYRRSDGQQTTYAAWRRWPDRVEHERVVVRYETTYEIEVEDDTLPVGTELELTATTKGGTPRRDKRGGRVFDPAVLAVKVYATLRAPMTFQDAARAVQRAVMAGIWNRRDLGVEYMDWSKGRRDGFYTNQTRTTVEDALVSFRHALQGAAVRVAVVDQ